MHLTYLLAQHIKDVFNGNNWTDVNIETSLKDVDWKQAQQQTEASPNTIASLVYHLAFWNGIIMQRLKGETPIIPEGNGFDVPYLNNEEEWTTIINKTKESFMELSEAVHNFPEEKLLENYAPGIPSSFYRNMQGCVEHAHYHLGQIIILKNMVAQ
ncbi:MAG: DinB family protein [Bacteroidetes bacterium]|nr:DinB family protein [Bacteroidota bacterium]